MDTHTCIIVVVILHLGLVIIRNVSCQTCAGDSSASSCNQWGSHAENECIFNPEFVACYCSLSCQSTVYCDGSTTYDEDCRCRSYASQGKFELDSATYSLLCVTSFNLRQSVSCAGTPPSVISHATVDTGDIKPLYRYMDRVRYNCDTGYVNGAYGRPALVCANDTQWHWGIQLNNESCKLIDCGIPENIKGASVNYENTTYLSNATYTCSDGTERLVECGLSEKWEGTELFACAEDGGDDAPKEAAGAVIFGVFGIAVLLGVIGFIIALDCMSCPKHFALGKRNTRRFRRNMKMKLCPGCVIPSDRNKITDFKPDINTEVSEPDVMKKDPKKTKTHNTLFKNPKKKETPVDEITEL